MTVRTFGRDCALPVAALIFATGAAAMSPKSPARVGDVEASGYRVVANPVPGGPAAGYLTLETRDAPDRLVAASSPSAMRVELHQHTLGEQGIARMRPVEAIEISPEAPTILEPGGLHLMIFGLSKSTEPGGEVELTLSFETAGELTIMAPVVSIGQARQGDHGH